MKLSDFYYDLPPELIAQHPSEKRDESRLLVLDRKTGKVEHRVFKEIIEYLAPGDCLVINETRVIPARLYGKRETGEGVIEILLLKDLGDKRWEVLVKPGKKCKIGTRIVFGEGKLVAEVQEILEDGNRIVKLEYDGILNEILDEIGVMPLPPYIHEKLKEKERYQTVYSKIEGSSAAPTAGLHFTPELLKQIEDKGVKIARVLLHVGLGTFRPVKEENIEDHKMHSEYYEISQEACDIINSTKQNGGKVFCVGTTSCRTVESAADENGHLEPQSGNTEIFIYPGYKFKLLDNLITNFHLPESTLLMLISALAGRELIMDTYKIAVEERYRFFSFGDAMLIK
ncbi:MAG: tRNA preQ1(34) S-adenosylmethionine ribosyltransferase-isomerase QueA [Clostridia bacterium]|nr:tRNA preQ1(34) S-adenosylmethionine ribosyltransferase-isomerase QueA [Clostridia bacterium]